MFQNLLSHQQLFKDTSFSRGHKNPFSVKQMYRLSDTKSCFEMENDYISSYIKKHLIYMLELFSLDFFLCLVLSWKKVGQIESVGSQLCMRTNKPQKLLFNITMYILIFYLVITQLTLGSNYSVYTGNTCDARQQEKFSKENKFSNM